MELIQELENKKKESSEGEAIRNADKVVLLSDLDSFTQKLKSAIANFEGSQVSQGITELREIQLDRYKEKLNGFFEKRR